MRPDRRAVLAGVAAGAALAALPGWAAVSSPAYLAAAKEADGSFALHGLSAGLETVFSLPLPGRGHAAAAHPVRAEAVAFARRPGTFAVVLDCAEGREIAPLSAPEGRHFYGHGAFSADGRWLYTTENLFATGEGRVGVWDASDRYRRVGDFASGGIGPHEVRLMPGGRDLIVANGGIQTHPEKGAGREKLNLSTMRSTLTRITAESGEITGEWALPPALQLNSMRHVAVRGDELVAAAMQWEGDEGEVPPLLAVLDPGAEALRLLAGPEEEQVAMAAYAASVAISADGRVAGITSPEGGAVQLFDLAEGTPTGFLRQAGVTGIAPMGTGFVLTDGMGRMRALAKDGKAGAVLRSASAWDNHIVPL